MPTSGKTLVVAAATCTLVGLFVTYTVGQSGVSQRSGDDSAHRWKSEDAPPQEVSNADDQGDGSMSSLDSALFWSRDMGDQPRDLGNQALTSGAANEDAADVEQQINSSANGLSAARLAPVNTEAGRELSPQASEFLTTLQGLEARLQKLGASYYKLESSEDGRSFRFHCEMPLSNQPGFHRFFSANADSPESSMERVINAVEHWLAVNAQN